MTSPPHGVSPSSPPSTPNAADASAPGRAAAGTPGRSLAPLVAPSLLAANFAVDAARLVDGEADWLHVDIMDDVFVPNRTIGLAEVQTLRAATKAPFDCHLMIVEPQLWATRYAQAGAASVTFHAEAAHDPIGLARDIRAAGARPGLAVDRDTPIEPYLELLPHFDLLLVMTIKAGFGGQEFLPALLDKVRTARRHAASGHLDLRIEVDGGIDDDTIGDAARAGADTFVAGTAVFRSADPVAAVRRLRHLAEAAGALDSSAPATDPAAGGAQDPGAGGAHAAGGADGPAAGGVAENARGTEAGGVS